MPVKVVLGYGFNNVGPFRPGFSEVHYYLPAVAETNDIGLNADVIALMNARTQLMGSNVIATMYRLSFTGPIKKSRIRYAVPTGAMPSPVLQTAVVAQGNCDIPNTSLKITLKSAQDQSRNMYLAGLPDSLIRTGVPVGPDFGAAGLTNYGALFNIWSETILNGKWGSYFLNQLPNGQPVQIAYWQQSAVAPFNLQFVLSSTALYQPNVGEIVHVRGTLMGVTGVPRPIGNWKIKAKGSVDPQNDYYELDKSSGYQAILVDIAGTVESVTKGYQAYSELGNILQTTRKRGIGPVRPRGRSRPRARRQPS